MYIEETVNHVAVYVVFRLERSRKLLLTVRILDLESRSSSHLGD